jgi:hypothetical protein
LWNRGKTKNKDGAMIYTERKEGYYDGQFGVDMEGNLYTNKLHATGGSIGKWSISGSGLTAVLENGFEAEIYPGSISIGSKENYFAYKVNNGLSYCGLYAGENFVKFDSVSLTIKNSKYATITIYTDSI